MSSIPANGFPVQGTAAAFTRTLAVLRGVVLKQEHDEDLEDDELAAGLCKLLRSLLQPAAHCSVRETFLPVCRALSTARSFNAGM